MLEGYDWMVRKLGKVPSAMEAMEFGFREGCRNSVTEQHLLLSSYKALCDLANREDAGSKAWNYDVSKFASAVNDTCRKISEFAEVVQLTKPF